MKRISLVVGFLCCSLFLFCQDQSSQPVVNVNIKCFPDSPPRERGRPTQLPVTTRLSADNKTGE